VTLLLDAAPLVALAEQRDDRHGDVRRVLRDERSPLVLSAHVAAEVDYLLTARIGGHASRALLRDLATGRYEVACLEAHDYPLLASLAARYRDLSPGLADLPVVVLAARYQTRRVLTFDYRHLRALEPIQGGEFELLPA
jgi:predicted nucleic acid-binding protein